MILKRITALLICFFLCMSITVLSYTENEETLGSEYTVLCELNILPEHTLNYKPSQKITRGDFASIVYNLLNLKRLQVSVQMNEYFSDINKSVKGYNEINVCAKYNLVCGMEDGRFYPNNKITLSQATKILMSALGYDVAAKVHGGYPQGYMFCASEQKVLNGVNASLDENITFSDAVALIYNSFSAKIMQQVKFGKDISSYDNNNGESVLSIYHDIDRMKGYVKATKTIALTDVDGLDDDNVIIDSVTYKTNILCDEFVGMNVYFYYSESDKRIVAVEPEDSKVNVFVINADDIVDFDGKKIKYLKKDKIREAEISLNTDIAYNGRVLKSIEKSDIMIKNGQIKVVDSYINKGIEALIINSYDDFLVKISDEENMILYDMYDSNKKISVKNMDDYSFRDEFGNDMNFGEINEYDVVSVMMSKDGKYANLYYSNTEKRGTITSIEGKDDKMIIGIDEKNYPISVNYAEKAKKLKVGSEGLFVMNVFGEVVGLKPSSSAYYMGYYISSYIGKGIDAECKIKLLGENGKILVYTLSDRIYLDENITDDDKAVGKLEQKPNGQVIRYKISNNKIKYIDTVNKEVNESDNSLCELMLGYDEHRNQARQFIWNSYQGILGLKIPVPADTVIFVVPKERSTDDRMYRVKTRNQYVQDHSYCVDSYRIGTDSHIAKALVMYNNNTESRIDLKKEVAIVDHISEFLNADGMKCTNIYALYEGKMCNFIVENEEIINNLMSINPDTPDEKHKLVCGDVIRVLADEDTNVVDDLALCFERESQSIYHNTVICTEVDRTDRMMKAKVYSNDSGNIWLTQDELSSPGIKLGVDEIESIQGGLFRVYKYSEKGMSPCVSIGSLTDIIDYCSSETDYSNVAVFTKYNDPGVIYLYE